MDPMFYLASHILYLLRSILSYVERLHADVNVTSHGVTHMCTAHHFWNIFGLFSHILITYHIFTFICYIFFEQRK